jgi:type II secretory pathway component GspD/PulD (secretin)
MNCVYKNRFISFFIIILIICSSIRVHSQLEENLISLDFVDANIHDVVRVLAAAKNYNFIIGSDVGGSISIKLDNVSLNTALEAVVSSSGYRYRISENVLKIDTAEKFADEDAAKKESLALEQLVTVVFNLKYINGRDVEELLKTQLTERGKIIPMVSTIQGNYSSTGMTASANLAKGSREATRKQETVDKMIAIDTVEAISKVKKLLDELDVMPIQILIESKLVESQFDLQSDLGVRWDFLGGGADGTGGVRIGAKSIEKQFSNDISNTFQNTYELTDERTQGLIDSSSITGQGWTFGGLDMADYLKENFLTSTPQGIYNNSTASGYKLHPDNAASTQNIISDSGSVPNFGYSFNQGQNLGSNIGLSKTLGRLATATLNASDFSLVLNALKTKNGTEVISNPSVMTLNNHEAAILVGERYPILKSSVSDVGTVVQTFDRYEPVGVQLQVLPRVLHNDYVSMIIKPAVTTIGASVGTAQLQINRINTREASTHLIVASGETIVIGGLISDQSRKNGSAVPFLSKLPLFGKLFSYKHKDSSKVNLTVFVTPTIVNNNT